MNIDALEVSDFHSNSIALTPEELRSLLSQRYGDSRSNYFEIFPAGDAYPMLALFVRDQRVVAYYNFDGGSLCSQGNGAGHGTEVVEFEENAKGALVGLAASSIISIDQAIELAHEFASSPLTPPLSVEWLEL